jgi:heat shock protein HslJ
MLRRRRAASFPPPVPVALLALLVLLVLLAGAACSRSAPGGGGPVPEPPGVAYAIRGEERPNWTPGWRAVILDGRLVLDSPTSAGWYAAVLGEPRVEGRRRTYVTEELTLVVEEGACGLADHREVLPDRVTLAWDAGRFEGCGGPRAPAAGLAGTSWELVRLGGEPAPDSRTPPAVVTFWPDGSVGGTEACNDTGGTVRWTEEGFVPLPGRGRETTAMGCGDERAVAFGTRFWTGLAGATTWRRDGDRLVIRLADGTEAELRFLL